MFNYCTSAAFLTCCLISVIDCPSAENGKANSIRCRESETPQTESDAIRAGGSSKSKS